MMIYNQDGEVNIKAKNGKNIKIVEDFKYLGSYVNTSSSDIKIRKALAWTACHNMLKVWKPSLSRNWKIQLFVATVESILLYRCNTWTLTKSEEKSLDGTYTCMLRMALNISWKEHKTNEELYGNLQKILWKIAERRCKIAGHCVRHPEEKASKTILWEPTEGSFRRGRTTITYIDVLKRDTGLHSKELRTVMLDRDTWKGFVSKAQTRVWPK